jgi:acetate kinase
MKVPKSEGLILVLNLGSSSLKFSLINIVSLKKEWVGFINEIGTNKALLQINNFHNKQIIKKEFDDLGLENAFKQITSWLDDHEFRYDIKAIGYRVVLGGQKYIMPQQVSEELLKDLEFLTYLAPNHLPDEIFLMRFFRKTYIGIAHVVCFDTFFHKDMPKVAQLYALPKKYTEMGLQRYGFHGLSYESIFKQLLDEDVAIINQKIIIAHLGSGASMVAIKAGTSKDTTMGISPLGGLVMATRSGDLDPGAILFMLQQDQLSAIQLDDVLSKNSGLKAICNLNDMQEIVDNKHKDKSCALAIDLFCYQARKSIGTLAAAIGGLDLLVFCGGVGENSSQIREQICDDLAFLGVVLNKKANEIGNSVISNPNNKVTVKVMRTHEDLIIATHIKKILSTKK